MTGTASAVAATVEKIIGGMTEHLDEVVRRTQQILSDEIPELAHDTALLVLLGETVEANIATVFAALRSGMPMDHIEPPAVAIEYAQRLAQRDVPANAMVRAYRIGHQTVLGVMINAIRESDVDGDLAIDVIDRLTKDSFDYIDSISQRAFNTYHDERVRWQMSRNYDRVLHVRELLKGGEVDVDTATTLIRYPLRRTHLALIVWRPEAATGEDSLERFVSRLVKSINPREASLYLPADASTAWAWIPLPLDSPPDLSVQIREFVAAADDPPFIAVGTPMAGLAGFRRSHGQALVARRMSLVDPARKDRLIEAAEPGVMLAGLLSDDVAGVRRWVRDVLGPLASANENDARLRDTLRAFLQAGSSFKAAANDLHLHFNTVRYRVERAVQRRGRAIEGDRTDVEVALQLCHLMGTVVLGMLE